METIETRVPSRLDRRHSCGLLREIDEGIEEEKGQELSQPDDSLTIKQRDPTGNAQLATGVAPASVSTVAARPPMRLEGGRDRIRNNLPRYERNGS
jgi:hypothetical protein